MTEYQLADCQKALEEFAESTDDDAVYLRLKENKPRDSQWRYRRLIIEASEEIHHILSST